MYPKQGKTIKSRNLSEVVTLWSSFAPFRTVKSSKILVCQKGDAMEFKITPLHDLVCRGFETGDMTEYERELERNDSIMEKLFSDTMNGSIPGFYLKDDQSFKAYHRSTKELGKIQLSSGFYKNGELFPCYDVQMKTFHDMQMEGYSSGIWAIIQ